MTRLRVWAPEATQVEVEIGGARILLTASEGGWWSADVSAARPGTDYAFVLDGDKPLPDPRSSWQPHGVYGPSRVVDHGAFWPVLYRPLCNPWRQAVNLDGPGSDVVRRFFCDNALMWLREYHVDGLRIDAVHAFIDTSAVHFLERTAGLFGGSRKACPCPDGGRNPQPVPTIFATEAQTF
jgi:1,4-alpha-glucan branching enzyme